MRRALDLVYIGSGYLAGAFMIAILLLMLAMGIGRKVHLIIPDGDLFVGWSFAAASFLGLAHTFKSGDMIRISALLALLPLRCRKWAEMLSLTISLGFMAFFGWNACVFAFESWIDREPSLGVLATPLWIPQTGMALGICFLALALLDELIRVGSGLRPSYEKDEPTTPEEMAARSMEMGV